MGQRKFRHHIMIAGAAMLFVACSVKEDRRECPCWLDMFTSVCPAAELALSVWSGSGRMPEEKRTAEELSEGSTFVVPRDLLHYCSWAVTGGISVQNGIYTIRSERECDSLYTWRGSKDCRCESQKDTIVLHKQFCTVFMEVANPGSDTYPFTIRIRGAVKGYSLIDDRPVPGESNFTPAVIGNRAVFRLPRQKSGDPLMADFYDGDSYLYSSDIGEAISESGYDWKAPDLEDIRISVNYSRIKAVINICDWETGGTWSTEI